MSKLTIIKMRIGVPMAEVLVSGTVRLAALFYAARVLADVADVGSLRARRAVWTVGLLFFMLHVVAAFQFVHHWSHRTAWKETASRTAELVGWESGAGLWVNYVFTTIWLADVVAWWCFGPDYPRRFGRITIAVRVVFAFLWFNATVVFGPPVWRPVVAIFALTLAIACVIRARK